MVLGVSGRGSRHWDVDGEPSENLGDDSLHLHRSIGTDLLNFVGGRNFVLNTFSLEKWVVVTCPDESSFAVLTMDIMTTIFSVFRSSI